MQEIWRGWQGHFCCGCKFHLNTLLKHNDRKVVVSTVGHYYYEGKLQTIGYNRTFETMVFEAGNNEWDDIDAAKQLDFFGEYNDEKSAQQGHYDILEQVKRYLEDDST
jgi:hypothetical protein